MQNFLDIAYQNVECIEQIVTDILAIALGFGVPIFVCLFSLLFLVSFFLFATEGIIDSLIARKDRLKDKVALLDNGYTSSSYE